MAILFLGVFAFVIVPRNLWHHHDSVEHVHHSGGQSGPELSASDDCPICDFQLLPYHFQLDEVTFSVPTEVSTKLFVFYEGLLPSPFQEIAARGPPTLALPA